MTRARGGAVPTSAGGADATPSAAPRPSPKPEIWRDPEYVKWIATLSCTVCGKPGPSDPAHLRTKRVHGDDYLVPLCHPHHVEQHQSGIQSFCAKYDIGIETRPESYRDWWCARQHREF